MKFKAFKALVENQINHKIKFLRSDNGGEFTSNEFNKFCEIDELRDNFQQQELLSKMEYLREKIGQSRK